ncbi:tyrosine lyase ThiH [Arachidicoccus rhizosphaerae]|uniref:Tyrosine lyase ThiH n=1 Tax=Arachidicoccus rhizosphaerae TaxID=551991 RepID=A0A1H3Z0D7_9BACT|nr:2-iminoacetate synthase ThiH [Arachidicoccus rhizosphaerae]SEA16804.1 tyrosine lyase ThiH [Arachidicoccus rhizosphaerae]
METIEERKQTQKISQGSDSSFLKIFNAWDWVEVQKRIQATTDADVLRALHHPHPGLSEFMSLLSARATAYLEPMARKATQLTQKRFGRTIRLFAPLYLSNKCQNICTYCGFSLDNKIPRKTLTSLEIEAEAAVLKQNGFDQILLVTGEAAREVDNDYFIRAVSQLKKHFTQISLEVQPLYEDQYKALHMAGAYGITVYQETYHREAYKEYHLKGRKANFDFRLETAERACKAGIHKIGMGVLLGLQDWRVDSFMTMMHLKFLRKNYWQTQFSLSFPRLRPAAGALPPAYPVTDKELVQLILAYRLVEPDLDISLSTRESETFRNHLIRLGITTMSAGSKTNPGGYSAAKDSLEQFEISDERSVAQICRMIQAAGYNPVFKDWDNGITGR